MCLTQCSSLQVAEDYYSPEDEKIRAAAAAEAAAAAAAAEAKAKARNKASAAITKAESDLESSQNILRKLETSGKDLTAKAEAACDGIVAEKHVAVIKALASAPAACGTPTSLSGNIVATPPSTLLPSLAVSGCFSQ